MKDRFCQHCGIWIAPFDPAKVELQEGVFHSACLKEQLQSGTGFTVNVKQEPQQLTLFVQ